MQKNFCIYFVAIQSLTGIIKCSLGAVFVRKFDDAHKTEGTLDVNSSHEGQTCLEEDGWILLWINLHKSSMRRK